MDRRRIDNHIRVLIGIFIGVFLALFLIIFLVSRWSLQDIAKPGIQETKETTPKTIQAVAELQVPVENPHSEESQVSMENSLTNEGGIIRMTRLDDQGGENLVSDIFRGSDKIAEFKEFEDKIFDVKGEIPEGKVNFTNTVYNTYGEENYEKGQRQGLFKEYFKDNNQLKRKVKYYYGKQISVEEYYYDGVLRMEAQMQEAMWEEGEKSKGVGKLYYPDGKLRSEWDFTNTDLGGYVKSYDKDGVMESELKYDTEGNLIE